LAFRIALRLFERIRVLDLTCCFMFASDPRLVSGWLLLPIPLGAVPVRFAARGAQGD
jgi:hypothetical protein